MKSATRRVWSEMGSILDFVYHKTGLAADWELICGVTWESRQKWQGRLSFWRKQWILLLIGFLLMASISWLVFGFIHTVVLGDWYSLNEKRTYQSSQEVCTNEWANGFWCLELDYPTSDNVPEWETTVDKQVTAVFIQKAVGRFTSDVQDTDEQHLAYEPRVVAANDPFTQEIGPAIMRLTSSQGPFNVTLTPSGKGDILLILDKVMVWIGPVALLWVVVLLGGWLGFLSRDEKNKEKKVELDSD